MTTTRDQCPDTATRHARPATPHAVADEGVAPTVDALTEGRHRSLPTTVIALQRSAGNGAVSALMAARLKSPGEQAVAEIDGALKEIRRDEPVIDTVEKGLKAAQAAGVPVELEGPKPPASALAVTKTGFGPGQVAGKKPVPPPKPTPAKSPLGKVGAAPPKVAGGTGKAVAPVTVPTGAAAGAAVPAPLTADKRLQPPVAPTSVRPEEDPAFTQVTGNVTEFAKAKKTHPTAASKAKEAQDASLPPADDVAGQAKAAKADTMDAQQPGSFDKKAFIAAVKSAIEAKSPKTLKEADDYRESGKAGEVKGEVQGLVGQGKEGQAQDIDAATDAPPDTSKAVEKPVTPMAQEQPGQPVTIPAAGAVPKPAPAEQTNLEAGKHEANQEMADAGVSEQQLAKSNEPEFQQALADKQTAAAHADTAPGEFRQHEKEVIAQDKARAAAETSAGVAGMQGAKTGALAKLVAAKSTTKSKDEQRRAEVTTKVQAIFTATETDVKKILDGIDPKVETEFGTGEAAARAKFEAYVEAKMSAYKKDRYGGWLGGLRWAKDKLLGMPDKVNEFYDAGRELYLKEMDGVISRVADIVGGDLTAAKQRIAQGRNEIAAYVKSLPKDLQKVGSEASQDIADKFEQLESDVTDKQNAVVETLATKYVESRKGLDERIEALQAENKGLVDKAIGAIKAVINTIRELAAMLRNVLAKAASAIGDIISDPIGFLGNLISGIKGGIDKFFANIGAHLKKGLMGWLFGQLGEAGIELPDSFDLKGIIKLLASIFGLTWVNIRNRLVRQIGEKAMVAVEKGVEVFQVIKEQGVGGLWQMLVEKLGNIKDTILEQVEDFVLTKIITAGITWLISLLNPAAAFIKACKLIYDVVMFFVNNASRIMAFVNTVIDGIVDIAKGNVGKVVDKVESALGQMVPILIGFIASVLGIGGIGQKIRSIITALQKPVMKAVDFVIKQGLKLAGPIIRGLKGIGGKVKAKVAAGKVWVKGKASQVKSAIVRLFKKSFSVSGTTHTVEAADGESYSLSIASRKRSVAAHARDAAKMAMVKRKPQLAKEAMALVDKAAKVQANLRAKGDEKAKRAALSAFTQVVKDVWARIGYQGEPPTSDFFDDGTKGIVGEVGPHKEQGSRGYSGADTRAEKNRLESEHVVPRDWILAFIQGFFKAVKLGSDEDATLYKSMTTVMLYKPAADYKTEKGKTRDNVVRSKLRALVSGHPDAKDPKAVSEAVKRNFDGPIASRIRLTKEARDHDHRVNRRKGAKTPSDSVIEGAAMRQLLDVITFLAAAINRHVEKRQRGRRRG